MRPPCELNARLGARILSGPETPRPSGTMLKPTCGVCYRPITLNATSAELKSVPARGSLISRWVTVRRHSPSPAHW